MRCAATLRRLCCDGQVPKRARAWFHCDGHGLLPEIVDDHAWPLLIVPMRGTQQWADGGREYHEAP